MWLNQFDFRIWDNEENKYIYDDIGVISIKNIKGPYKNLVCESKAMDKEIKISIKTLFYDRYEIELWTGLTDKNGKKIYEGDIVEFTDDFDDIYFLKINFSCIYGVSFTDDDNANFEINIGLIKESFEVVGNIHENKDLLNK